MRIAITLTPEQEAQLMAVAAELHVPALELAAAALRDLLAGPTEEFQAAAHRVLDKNRELYRRLA